MRGTVHFDPAGIVSGEIRFDCCAYGACVTDDAGGTRHLCMAEVARIEYDWSCPTTRRAMLGLDRRRG